MCSFPTSPTVFLLRLLEVFGFLTASQVKKAALFSKLHNEEPVRRVGPYINKNGKSWLKVARQASQNGSLLEWTNARPFTSPYDKHRPEGTRPIWAWPDDLLRLPLRRTCDILSHASDDIASVLPVLEEALRQRWSVFGEKRDQRDMVVFAHPQRWDEIDDLLCSTEFCGIRLAKLAADRTRLNHCYDLEWDAFDLQEFIFALFEDVLSQDGFDNKSVATAKMMFSGCQLVYLPRKENLNKGPLHFDITSPHTATPPPWFVRSLCIQRPGEVPFYVYSGRRFCCSETFLDADRFNLLALHRWHVARRIPYVII